MEQEFRRAAEVDDVVAAECEGRVAQPLLEVILVRTCGDGWPCRRLISASPGSVNPSSPEATPSCTNEMSLVRSRPVSRTDGTIASLWLFYPTSQATRGERARTPRLACGFNRYILNHWLFRGTARRGRERPSPCYWADTCGRGRMGTARVAIIDLKRLRSAVPSFCTNSTCSGEFKPCWMTCKTVLRSSRISGRIEPQTGEGLALIPARGGHWQGSEPAIAEHEPIDGLVQDSPDDVLKDTIALVSLKFLVEIVARAARGDLADQLRASHHIAVVAGVRLAAVAGNRRLAELCANLLSTDEALMLAMQFADDSQSPGTRQPVPKMVPWLWHPHDTECSRSAGSGEPSYFLGGSVKSHSRTV